MEAIPTLNSRTALQLYLLLIAAVACLMRLTSTAIPRHQNVAPESPGSGSTVGYGYSGERPATLESRLEAIRLNALDPYREHGR